MLRSIEHICWIAGVAALGWCIFVCADRFYFQASQARRFMALRREGAGPANVLAGGVVGKLSIPEIGVSAMILEGDDEKTLRRAVGHIPGTALPEQSGTVGIAGHRDTFFRNLGKLHANDAIVLETQLGTYLYRVSSTAVVAPNDTAVFRPHDGNTLTLVTCYPFRFIGPAPRRFVVTARLVQTVPLPKGQA